MPSHAARRRRRVLRYLLGPSLLLLAFFGLFRQLRMGGILSYDLSQAISSHAPVNTNDVPSKP